MEKRQELLLKLIVESYIKTAEPVGSNFLVLKSGLDISAPTVRNEMRELEEEGFLTHPHTSAGRIPTELGYQFYVENLMETVELKKRIREEIEQVSKSASDQVARVKNVSRKASELMSNAVIVAFNRDNIYYTGISYLFSQPEFRDQSSLMTVSGIFDHCEERLDEMFETIGNEIDILIGQKNPFGRACGLVATKLNGGSLMALVGPMRMDYGHGVGMIRTIKELL